MRNKIFMIISFLAAVLIVSSCLKDDIGEDWTASLKGKMYAEFPNNGPQVKVIQPVVDEQIFKFLVNIATDALPTSDITVSFALDPAAMVAYNAEIKAADPSITWSYELYPSIEIMDPTITIEAGTRNAYVHVKLSRGDTIRLSGKYMAPISITSVSDPNVIIAANKKTVLYKLPVANKWEGTYKMKGWTLREGDPVLTGYYSGRTYKLGTSGPNSVTLNRTISWGDSESNTVGGIGPWTITISEATVPNPIVVSDATNPAVVNLSTYPNRYDPATKTFYFSVYWALGPTNRAATDTLVYSGPY